jgi:hypothetical protein
MFQGFITDPGFMLTLRWMLAGIFLMAVVHKLKDPVEFRVSLEDYQLLPNMMLRPAFFALVTVELLISGALLLNVRVAGLVAAILLFVYTMAIAINLIRGRTEIDCGCSGPAVRQTLSVWLVARNTGLIFMALLSLFDNTGRELGLLDGFTALFAAGAFVLIYSAAAQLSLPEYGGQN